MRTGFRPALAVLTALALVCHSAGCSGSSGSGKGGGDNKEEEKKGDGEDGAPPADRPKSDTSWVFRSAEHGFSLTLPSADWKPTSRKKMVAEFYAFRLGAPMLVGVVSVRKQTPDEFREASQALKARAEKAPGLLSPPSFHEEQTGAGDRRASMAVYEKGAGGFEYLFAVRSLIWLKDRGITVELVFEGQGKMKSKLFQTAEKEAFEKAALAIHRSVK